MTGSGLRLHAGARRRDKYSALRSGDGVIQAVVRILLGGYVVVLFEKLEGGKLPRTGGCVEHRCLRSRSLEW